MASSSFAVLAGGATVDSLHFLGGPSKLKMADRGPADAIVDVFVESVDARSQSGYRTDKSFIELGDKHRLAKRTVAARTVSRFC